MASKDGVGRLLLLLTLAALLASGARGDWPRFLGPALDGTTEDERLVAGWRERGLEPCWRRPVGEGYSGLAVAAGAVYSLDSDGGSEYLFSVDAADGSERWRLRLGPAPRDWYGGLGPRVTPSLAGGLLVVMAAEGDLIAVAADTGRVVWRQPVRRRMAGRFPVEGYAASALIVGDRVHLPVGGPAGRAVAAFDLDTGEPAWATQDDRAAYASPIRARLAGREQILFLTASKLFAVEPVAGELLWSWDWPTYDGVNAASPLVIGGDRVFLSAGYDQGAVMLQVTARDGRLHPRELWRSRVMRNHFNNSVHHAGVLYGFDESNLAAVDAADGTRLWRQRGLGKGSVILVSGHLMVLSEDGELYLARPSREQFDVLDRRQVLSGRSWTPPSVAAGRIYLRNRSEMVCLRPVGGSRAVAATTAEPR